MLKVYSSIFSTLDVLENDIDVLILRRLYSFWECRYISQRCALFAELIYVCMFYRGVLYLQNTISTWVKFPNKSAAHFNRLSAPASATLHVTVTSQKTSVWPQSYWLWKVLLYCVNIIIWSWRKCRNRRRYKSLESCTVSTKKTNKYSRSVSKKQKEEEKEKKKKGRHPAGSVEKGYFRRCCAKKRTFQNRPCRPLSEAADWFSATWGHLLGHVGSSGVKSPRARRCCRSWSPVLWRVS